VLAPTASGLTESGRKLAAVPVVPHSIDARMSAHTPDELAAGIPLTSRG